MLRLIVRQLLRNRRRTLLTFLGLVISFFLFTSLESILFSLGTVLKGTASETGLFLRPRSRASFFRAELPTRYTDHVRAVDGVVAASPLRFFFGRGREEGSFAAAIGVEMDDYLAIRPLEGVTPEEVAAVRADRRGALVGGTLLAANDWKVGDRITIRGVGRLPSISFTVRGDIDADDRLGRVALVHFDYLEDLLGGAGRASFIQARVAHPALAPAIARAIDDRFANFIVPTVTQSERSHVASVVASLSDVLRALRVIGTLTLAITVLVVGNSVAMGIRERTVEIGTLRAVGFGRLRVLGLVLGEAIAVSVLGGTVGAVAAWACFELGWIQLPQRIGFRLISDPTVVARAALLAIPVGALAGFQPAWSAVRMSITDALRWAE